MSLTTLEHAKVRTYLGYSSVSQGTTLWVDSYLTSLTTDGETMVRDLLTQIDRTISILDGETLDGAGIKSMGKGDLEFFQGSKPSEVRSTGRNQVGRLSIVTQVPIGRDYFGGSGSAAGSILNSGAF